MKVRTGKMNTVYNSVVGISHITEFLCNLFKNNESSEFITMRLIDLSNKHNNPRHPPNNQSPQMGACPASVQELHKEKSNASAKARTYDTVAHRCQDAESINNQTIVLVNRMVVNSRWTPWGCHKGGHSRALSAGALFSHLPKGVRTAGT